MFSYITGNLLHGITKLCSNSIQNIYETAEYIITGCHPDIINKLQEIDVVNKIKIIDAFITE